MSEVSLSSLYPLAEQDYRPTSANVEDNPLIRRNEWCRNAAIKSIRAKYNNGHFGGIKTAFMIWLKGEELMDKKIARYAALTQAVSSQTSQIVNGA